MIKKKEIINISLAMSCALLITLSIILSGCATSKNSAKAIEQNEPPVIDPANFDPVDFWAKMTTELEARRKTKVTTYYLVGNTNVRFLPAATNEKEIEPPLAYEAMNDIKGRTYYISKTTALDSNDIEFVYIEKSSYKGKDQYIIGVLFKEKSWDKVRAVTESLIKKNLAFMKDRVILSAPSVYEPLVEQAQVSGDFTKADIDQFIKGLVPTNPPPTDGRDAAHIEWLQKRLEQHPDDLQSLTRLAWRYYESKEKDCRKTSKIYEQLIMRDPSRSIDPYLQLLHACYAASGNYADAITVYYLIIAERKMEPYQEVYVRVALADAFANKGEKDQALQELEKASSVVKEMTFSYPWIENSAHKTEIEQQISESKKQLLKLINAAKEKVESEK